MAWKISEKHIQFFRDDLWKDERSFVNRSSISEAHFSKDCFTNEMALLEFNTLSVLYEFNLSPKPLRVENEILYMERKRGIRLFDLIRLLREASQDASLKINANTALSLIIERVKGQVTLTQKVLIDNAVNYSYTPYPIYKKISSLLKLFIEVFSLRVNRGVEDALRNFESYWDNNCALLPFRDATTKNYIFADSKFDLTLLNTEKARKEVLNKYLLNFDSSFWTSTPILGIDFSSVEHLTTPEDDVISLFFHEWTYGLCPVSADKLLLTSSDFNVDSYRAAATLLVRFLRFGGRKLAYKLINSQGFEVRFKYDNPDFYFSRVRQLCNSLNPEFVQDYSSIFDVIDKINQQLINISSADEALLRIDHFRHFYGESGKYWQETPCERLNND